MVGAGVGLVYDERMCAHANLDDPFHPEKPTRITAIYKSLDSAGVVGRCERVEARDATPAELASVHTEEHIVRMCGVSSKKYGQGKRAAMARRYNSIYFNEGSSSSALLAAGSVVEVCLRVARGDLRAGAAVVRPPGHHAEVDTPMGFCLFNNVAVAAHVLVHGNPDLGVRKVLIVDWDVHHGNGTQHMFWRDPQVLYFSIHRHDFGDFYPGGDDGDYDRVGEGSGAGFNINVPWPHNGFGDLDYLAVFDHVLMPVAQEFNPDLVLVSGGFDSAMGDPLGGCEVTPAGYSQMTKRLMGLANGRIVLALEGGYNLKSISDSYLACMKVLLGEQPEKIIGTKHHISSTIPLVQQVRSELEQYWLVLSAKVEAIGKVDDKEIINLAREVEGISGGIANADLLREPNQKVAELKSSALFRVDCIGDMSSLSSGRQSEELNPLLESFNKDLALDPDNNKFTTGSSVDSSHLAKRDGDQKQLTNLEGVQAAGLGDVRSPSEGSQDAIISNQHQEDDSDHKQNLTQNNLGCKLSSADGGVCENHGVTVSEDGGLPDGDKCKVPGVADSLILSPDQKNPETTYVWYACYASNTWAARFMCYIKGGQVEGLTKCCVGARNQAPPVASRWMVVPYRLFFGRSSRSWGSGGVAFLDPVSHGGAPTTKMRLYKITLQQLCDILTQENDEDLKSSQLLIEWDHINKLWDVHSAISHSTIQFLEDAWYGTIKYLGDEDGLPILTITCSLNDMQKFRDGKLQMHNPPSESYRTAILRGLLEQGMWSEEESKAYIESKIQAS